MRMSTDKEVGDFETLLSAFRQQVPERPERLPTFLEITRYPHYEDVCSNILEFYLDPKKPHGLGTLFVDALACIGGIEHQQGMWDNVEVTREEYTEAGNRIDILIQSDSHAVLIENKIFAGPDNPFADYAKHLDDSKRFPQDHKFKFLLTLKPDDTAREWGFQNITHQELVEGVRKLLGCHIAGADTRYLTFMLDFLKTLDDLPEGMVMDPKFLEFAKSHQPDIESLGGRVQEFKRELRGKINQLEEMVDSSNHSKVKPWKYHKEGHMWDTLAHEIEFEEDLTVTIEAFVSPNGWEIKIYLKGKTTNEPRLPELLSKQGIPYEAKDGGIRHKTCFEYDGDLKDIANLLQDVISKLVDARSSGNY